jgi:UDP-glucose 4-epimerase
MMKFVVTGGSGFIGSHLVERLLPRGEVVVLDDLSTGKRENLAPFQDYPNLEFVEGSVTDPALLKRISKNAHCIFHQAAIPSVQRSVEDPYRTNRANVDGTLNVLIAAKDQGVPKFVMASSSSVYGDTPVLPKQEDMPPHPLSPYAVSKLAGESYASVFSGLFGLQTVCLRYFNVYGPRQDPLSEYAAVVPRFITRILAGEPVVIHGDGGQTRDFTYVGDVVQANIRAMESDASGIFNIAHGTRISVNNLAERIMEVAGIRTGIIHDEPRPGDVRDSLADIARARQILGFTPQFGIERGLAETVTWFKNQR